MPAKRDPIDIAARALAHRDRSRREIEERLARAGVEEQGRADALETLERVGYVDDERFAAARAAALAERGYGDAAIGHDLAAHGVDGEVAEPPSTGSTAEPTGHGALVDRLGRTAKTAAHLARKGFAEDSLEAAIGADVAQRAGLSCRVQGSNSKRLFACTTHFPPISHAS